MRTMLVPAVLLLLQQPPPAYPRPGATSVLENEHVIVWDIAWLQQEYPLHRHRYDHAGVYYASGDRIIISPEGERRRVSTQAWNISFQRRDVTHAEQGTSAEPLRAVFIQIKREPREEEAPPTASPAIFPLGAPLARLDNDRVRVWEYDGGGTAVGRHGHAHDAVVVSFDAAGKPQVRWIDRGAVHHSDGPAGATRTFVFEIR